VLGHNRKTPPFLVDQEFRATKKALRGAFG
jgi:hypothetical protein